MEQDNTSFARQKELASAYHEKLQSRQLAIRKSMQAQADKNGGISVYNWTTAAGAAFTKAFVSGQ